MCDDDVFDYNKIVALNAICDLFIETNILLK